MTTLPSIHEMFPDHLIPSHHHHHHHHHRRGPSPPSASSPLYAPAPVQTSGAGPSVPRLRDAPPPPPAHARADDMDVDMDAPDAGDAADAGPPGKKHVCPTCLKRFNRPSSLRIHVNTHTGATREFLSFVLPIYARLTRALMCCSVPLPVAELRP